MQELLAENPGEAEQDVWDRLSKSEVATEKDIPKVRATTRSKSQPSTATPEVPGRKFKLGVKVKLDGNPTPQPGQSADKSSLSRPKFANGESEALVFKSIVTADSVANLRKEAMEGLDEKLSDRYAEFEQMNHVLSKIKFVDLTTWPEDLKDLSSFCVDDVQWLLNHFRVPLQNADIEEDIVVLRQFRDLKMYYGPRLADGEIKKSSGEIIGCLKKYYLQFLQKKKKKS